MTVRDNDASRLHSLLSELDATWKNGITGHDHLARIYGSRTGETEQFELWLSGFLLLPMQVLNKVVSAELPSLGFTLPSLRTIRAGFSSELLLVSSRPSWLVTEHLVRLEAVKSAFETDPQLSTGSLPPEQRDALRRQLEELLRDIRDSSDLPTELRSFLAEMTVKMLRALVHYDIGGAEAVERVFHEYVGAAQLLGQKLHRKHPLQRRLSRLATIAFVVIQLFGGVNQVPFLNEVLPWADIDQNDPILIELPDEVRQRMVMGELESGPQLEEE